MYMQTHDECHSLDHPACSDLAALLHAIRRQGYSCPGFHEPHAWMHGGYSVGITKVVTG